MRRRRKNPIKSGLHPDLFEIEDTPIIGDWRDTPRKQLLKLAENNELDDETLDEIAEEDEDLYEKLVDADTEGREKRVQPVIDFLNERAASTREYELEDGQESYQDIFQSWLYDCDLSELFNAAAQVIPEIDEAFGDDPEPLDEVLRDPAMFYTGYTEGNEWGRAGVTGEVYTFYVDYREDQIELGDSLAQYEPEAWEAFQNLRTNQDLKAIDDAVDYSIYFMDDIVKFKAELNKKYPNININAPIDVTFYWAYDADELREALQPFMDDAFEKPVEPSPETDDVVYKFKDGFYIANLPESDLRWEGRKQGICVGKRQYGYRQGVLDGKIAILSLRTPSGKPKLTFNALLWDTQQEYPYPFNKGGAGPLAGAGPIFKSYLNDGDEERFRERLWVLGMEEKTGLTMDSLVAKAKAYARAAEAGREDANVLDRITGFEQIKGKANRLPGFAAGNHSEIKFAPEIEKALEFVSSVGIHPQDIHDLKPGYEGLDDWKAEQEKKRLQQKADKAAKKARKNPPSIKVSKSIQREANAAYDEPFGGEW